MNKKDRQSNKIFKLPSGPIFIPCCEDFWTHFRQSRSQHRSNNSESGRAYPELWTYWCNIRCAVTYAETPWEASPFEHWISGSREPPSRHFVLVMDYCQIEHLAPYPLLHLDEVFLASYNKLHLEQSVQRWNDLVLQRGLRNTVVLRPELSGWSISDQCYQLKVNSSM